MFETTNKTYKLSLNIEVIQDQVVCSFDEQKVA